MSTQHSEAVGPVSGMRQYFESDAREQRLDASCNEFLGMDDEDRGRHDATHREIAMGVIVMDGRMICT